MHSQQSIERFFETLTTGNRPRARAITEELTAAGWTAQRMVADLFWPTYELIDRLHREDQLSTLAHHTATRLLRVLVDQNSARLERSSAVGRKVMAFCGPAEADEMGAQMAVDMLEAQGFEVTFAGGGIASDEILAQVNNTKPDVVMMFASGPADLPGIRALIDTVREVGACPDVQFAVGAGVFNRAEGLAEEIGADLWASTPLEMVEVLVAEPDRRATSDQRTVGGKKIRRRAA
ncbi:MAG TPA: cobalamin-dependent protein [Phycisphaerales bacterium]|nr:cobalamin-dependent protein [Phycisphaerales bacterium]